MVKKPSIALPGKRKDKYKPVMGHYGWDLGKLVFDKEEPRSKKCGNVDKNVDNFLSNYEK